MPKCVMCKTTFCRASSSGPAEDCDCGQNVTRERALEMSEDEWQRARDWALRVMGEPDVAKA